jgi:tetratricopeptide (TPR) repeat protein
MGFATAFGHDFDRSLAYCQDAIRIASEIDATPVMANAYVATALVHAVTARLDESTEGMETAVRMAEAANDAPTFVMAKAFTGHLLNWQGDYRGAWQRQVVAVERARQHGIMFPLFWSLWQYGVSLTGGGRYDDAIEILQEGLAVCEKSGEEIMRHRILNTLGWTYLECGDLDRAIEFNRQGAEAARKRGDDETIANPELNLGDAFLARGDVTLAREFLEGVHGRVRKPTTSEWMKWRYSTHLFASLGELALAAGDRDAARRFADECLEIATRTRAKRYLVKGWRIRGEVALERRNVDEAHECLRNALAIAQAIDNPPQLVQTHAAVGRLEEQRGHRDAATREYRSAHAVIVRVAASLRDARLRGTLESSAVARFVRDRLG